MKDLTRRILLALGAGSVVLVVYALGYRWGMATFEGEQLSFIRSLQVVLEALTTAGFGGDAPWSSPEMNLLIIAMNLTGVSLVFFGIPFFIIPLLEDAITPEIPTETALTDHIIVCTDSVRETAHRQELVDRDVPILFLKRDADEVQALRRDDIEAIQGNPETREALENANIGAAKAMLVDTDDEVSASIILAARRVAPDLRILSVVEDSQTESYHRYAGADEVVRPRVAVGKRLAAKVAGAHRHESLGPSEAGSEHLELTEILIEEDSEFVGEPIADCAFEEQFGSTVLGGWFHGEFIAPVEPDKPVHEHTVLLMLGHADELKTLRRNVTEQPSCQRVIVAGYGVVGQTVTESLRASGVSVTVVDTEAADGVDVVGDITDPEILDRVDASEADSIVLSLSRDSLAVYAALVIRDVAEDVDIVARADDVSSVQNSYDAGVGFTLSRAEVTGHMAATRLFGKKDSVEGSNDRQIARLEIPKLAGQRFGETSLAEAKGIDVITVLRDGQFQGQPSASFEFQPGDEVYLAVRETVELADGITAFDDDPSP
jgi:Trk K+ transport system NAD-binding subunit